ncbi:hypothetical protein ACJMK2_043944 [Sinanodonta woodiana]|uniref:very-long-chain (3R)-3-hydroxyacyl-CoA dehydratase n=1 Tax=Sinanodonta woodiana TaxID=1069815 RepID=A0ABD3VYF6_SINWO
MADTLNPLVYWGQKDDQIFLKVDLRDVTDESLDVTEDSIKFEAYGVGQKGRNRYEFDLDFYLPVEADSGKYKKTDREFQIQIKKKGEGEVWPRLTQKQMKYPWLKIDFDKFIVEDDSENEDEKAKEAAEKEMMEKIEKDLMLGVDSTSLDFKVSYLFLYNMFQFVGYTYVCAILQYHFMKYGIVAKNQAFESVGAQLMVCQVAAILEILHPLLGLVKTGVFAPLMQVSFRKKFHPVCNHIPRATSSGCPCSLVPVLDMECSRTDKVSILHVIQCRHGCEDSNLAKIFCVGSIISPGIFV